MAISILPLQIIIGVRGLNPFPVKMIVDSVAIDKELWTLSAAAGGCRIEILLSERPTKEKWRLLLAKLRAALP
jgi:hypothetical protein